MDELLAFLASQKLLTIATEGSEPWIANVYYGMDLNGTIYFVSSQETKHSQHILKNPTIAFNVAWYNSDNHKDRKAVQGVGICRIANTIEEITKGIELHNTNFPVFANRITTEWAMQEDNISKVWIIKPTYMKFWNDELYGEGGMKEFTFMK